MSRSPRPHTSSTNRRAISRLSSVGMLNSSPRSRRGPADLAHHPVDVLVVPDLNDLAVVDEIPILPLEPHLSAGCGNTEKLTTVDGGHRPPVLHAPAVDDDILLHEQALGIGLVIHTDALKEPLDPEWFPR